MLSKRYESTEVDRRTLLHAPFGTHGQPAETFTEYSWNTTKATFAKDGNTIFKWYCIFIRDPWLKNYNFMLLKRNKSIKNNRRTWIHMPSGTYSTMQNRESTKGYSRWKVE